MPVSYTHLGMGEFQNMLHAALNIGVDPVAIKETIYQATAYLEIGRINNFIFDCFS